MTHQFRLNSTFLLMLALPLLALVGCTGVKTNIYLEVPAAERPAAPKGRQIFIHSVVDQRRFQDHPASPEIPSLIISVTNSAKATRSRAVAKAGDSMGKEEWSIFLEDGQTVASVVAEAAGNALATLGYSVVYSQDKAAKNALVMDITVDQFWGWIRDSGQGSLSSDGMTMDGEIKTTMNMTGPDGQTRKFTLSTSNSQWRGLSVAYANWEKLFGGLLDDYMKQLLKGFDSNEPAPDEPR